MESFHAICTKEVFITKMNLLELLLHTVIPVFRILKIESFLRFISDWATFGSSLFSHLRITRNRKSPFLRVGPYSNLFS